MLLLLLLAGCAGLAVGEECSSADGWEIASLSRVHEKNKGKYLRGLSWFASIGTRSRSLERGLELLLDFILGLHSFRIMLSN
ncbi:hypothetical protein EV426DRAFT_621104 [Tirmania nivea]|nr:hypothetical protein EV426DRAFT_621104 [Tirmania nivea]